MNAGTQVSTTEVLAISPSGSIMAGLKSTPYYTDEEVQERMDAMEFDELADLGWLASEPIAAPDVDPGDQPEPTVIPDGVWF